MSRFYRGTGWKDKKMPNIVAKEPDEMAKTNYDGISKHDR